MSIFSDSVKAPLEAEWLLHLDPKAEIHATKDGLEAAPGGAVLELHRLLAEGSSFAWGRHKVAKPEVEPFTFRETTRVVVRPSFAGTAAFVLNLLRVRPATGPALESVRASRHGRRLGIRFTSDGRPIGIDWDLARWTATLEGGKP